MSVESRVVNALRELDVPVENSLSHAAVKSTYFVFTVNTVPTFFADDEPQYERNLVQVHLIAPLSGNLTSLIHNTKRALHQAGFTYPDSSNGTDELGRHIIFECEDEEDLDDGDL